MIEEGIAHAALVFDGDQAIAWCEYGSPAECLGSTIARSTTPGSPIPRPGVSPASSSIAIIDEQALRSKRSAERSTSSRRREAARWCPSRTS